MVGRTNAVAGGLPSDWTEEVTATALEAIAEGDAVEYRAFPGADVFNGAVLSIPALINRLAYSRDGNVRAYSPLSDEKTIVIQRKIEGVFSTVYTQTLSAGGVYSIEIPSNGAYVFIGVYYSNDTYGMVRAYKYDGDTTYTIADSYPMQYIHSIKVSPDNQYILVGRYSLIPTFYALKFTDDDITSLGAVENSVGSGVPYAIDCSNDGVYWICSHLVSSTGDCSIIKRTGDNFACTPNIEGGILQTYVGACAISPDGTKIALAVHSPYLRLYDYTNEVLTSITLPLALAGQIKDRRPDTNPMAFTYDGEYLIIGITVSPFITVLKVNADVPFTKLANPTYLPTAYPYCVERNGNNAVVLHLSTGACAEYVTGVGDFLMPMHSLRETRYYSLDQYGYYGVGMAKTAAAAGAQCTATMFKKINDAGV